jgi:geranylgeranyl pyrophosphate synthase
VIEAYLARVSVWPSGPSALEDAMRYALLGGGKRLRPILAWWSCVALGGRGEWSLPACAALEAVHAFSLVHDDLPALDNDDLRRGRPTLHKHAGEAMAILAGDGLLTHALTHLTCAGFSVAELGCDRAPTWASRPDGRHADEAFVRCALTHELASATLRMIHGQVWDTLGGLPPTVDDRGEAGLELIHEHKTGALITAACRMGGLSALGREFAGSAGEVAVTSYGRAIGLLFQVVDDLLDVTQASEHVGKRTQKDDAAGKRTYPGILGIDGTRKAIDRLRGDALRAVEPLGDRAAALVALCNYMAQRTK